jgi:hypothetical protein
MTDLPIACTLSPEALKARRENLLDALLQRSTEHTELPDGFGSASPRTRRSLPRSLKPSMQSGNVAGS